MHFSFLFCFQEVRGSTQVRPIDEASMSGRSFEFHVYTGDVWWSLENKNTGNYVAHYGS